MSAIEKATPKPPLKWKKLLAEFRPNTLEDWNRADQTLGEISEISKKEKEFLVVAIDAVAGWPGTKVHIDHAFDEGATIQEIVDVCLVAGWLKGPTAVNFGLSALSDVIEERQKAGRPLPRTKADL